MNMARTPWLAAGLLALGGLSSTAHADVIVSAVGATIDAGGPGGGSIANTFNQAGLFTGYTSGVTDFDTYIAGGPTHTHVFPGFEWFANTDATSAQVTYDLGSVKLITALVLWNEEGKGIESLDLSYSTDGVAFLGLASGLLPTDHPLDTDYLADVFSFGQVGARYVRFGMSGISCCAIGEVAFRQDQANVVSEPGSLALAGLALTALAGVARRRTKKSG